METLAVGFWGAFFGAVALMLLASVAAFARGVQRVALQAGGSAIVAGLCVAAYLGQLPVPAGDPQARLLSHMVLVTAVLLGLMLMAMRGVLRQRESARRAVAALAVPAAVVLVLGWLLPARTAFLAATATSFVLGFGLQAFAVRALLHRERQAWSAVIGVSCVLLTVTGLTWIALVPQAPWGVHAVSAVAGMAYLAVMASALSARYAYLLELAQVRALGPRYDPVTRMRAHAETGQLMRSVFHRKEGDRRLVGVLVVIIANLYALEKLHGRAACNHALFVCASRLRRTVPLDVQMGRLGDDGFLLLMRDAHDLPRLQRLARQLRERLVRPVSLSTSPEAADIEAGRATWTAEVGIGVLAAPPEMRPSQALTTALSLARAACAYPSRLAAYDSGEGRMVELSAAEAA